MVKLAAFWRGPLVGVTAAARNSLSTVSMRFLVSGPVSSMRWVPSGLAQQCSTPRALPCLLSSPSLGCDGVALGHGPASDHELRVGRAATDGRIAGRCA